MASSEPGTEAGRRLLLGWGGQAAPTRREILAIEAEAIAAERQRVREAVEGLQKPAAFLDDSKGEPEYWRGRLNGRREVLAIIDGAS